MSLGLLEISAAWLSEVGRRSNNEDCVRIAEAATRRLAIVADGAGGHEAGEEASRRAVASIEASLGSAEVDFAPTSLAAAVLAAHAELQDAQSAVAGTSRMHTTLVVLWIDTVSARALWAHVGDSRLYRVRGGAVEALTVDDSVVQSMVAVGLLTLEQAATHPQKNKLIAALGVEEAVDPHVIVAPVYLHEGDAYLLCTDGWWDVVDAEAIGADLQQAESAEQWLAAMAARVVAHDSAKQDNYSAVGVWVGDAGDCTWPAPLAAADAPG